MSKDKSLRGKIKFAELSKLVFDQAMQMIVRAFEQRAEKLYGKRELSV